MMIEYPLYPGSVFFKDEMPIRVERALEFPYLTRHRHDFVEVAYIEDGDGLHYVGDKIVRVSRGDLFLIPAYETHVFQPEELTGERPLRIINCLCQADKLGGAASQIPRRWRAYREHGGEFKRLLGRMFLEQRESSEASGRNLLGLWKQLIELLQSKSVKEDIQYVSSGEVPVHQALQHMSSRVMSRLTLSEMSRIVSMSSRHFQRVFKSVTGRSFMQMLQEMRIRYSCGMLQYTSWSVQSIAEKVGIYDMNYFYRLFRENCGMTPAAFRLLHNRGCKR